MPRPIIRPQNTQGGKKKSIQVVDLFCGAGGMTAGVEEGAKQLGLEPKITAINHWPIAVETHTFNYPEAHHICEDISNVNPRKLFGEGEVDLLVGGPSCVSHSAARGGRPLDCDQGRATPWCMVRWAEATPFLIQVAHGNKSNKNNNRRVKELGNPMPGLTGSPEWAIGSAHLQDASFMLHTNHHGEGRIKSIDDTFPTVCGNRGEIAIAISKLKIPASVVTIDNKGPKGSKTIGGVHSENEPLSTITSKARHVLVENEIKEIPNPTQSLKKSDDCLRYFKTDRKETQITEFNPDKEGLPTEGKLYVKTPQKLYEVDFLLRMFEPHELSLAQGFRPDYQFKGNKSQQVKQIGNAVPRRTVRALFLANWTQSEEVPPLIECWDNPHLLRSKKPEEKPVPDEKAVA